MTPTTPRSGLGPRLLAVASALVVVAAAVAALRSDPGDRTLLIGGLLFFGGCLLAALSRLRGQVPLLLAVGCITMGAGCVVIARGGLAALTAVAWFGAAFFGLGGLALLVLSLLPPPRRP